MTHRPEEAHPSFARAGGLTPLPRDRTSLACMALAPVVAGTAFVCLSGPDAVLACLLGLGALGIAASDARRFIVPDWLSLPLIPAGLLAAALTTHDGDPDVAVILHGTTALVAGLVLHALGLTYRKLRGVDGLGLGDVKLAAAAGAWTGPDGVSFVFLLACAGAIAFALLLRLAGRQGLDRQTMIPFGAFLAPAIWIVWLAQKTLIPL